MGELKKISRFEWSKRASELPHKKNSKKGGVVEFPGQEKANGPAEEADFKLEAYRVLEELRGFQRNYGDKLGENLKLKLADMAADINDNMDNPGEEKKICLRARELIADCWKHVG